MHNMTITDVNLWNWVKMTVAPIGSATPPSSSSFQSRAETFMNRIDLHGMATQTAFDTTKSYINAAKKQGLASVMIVTGKSGAMRDEFFHWMGGNENVSRCELLPSDGAFRVILKK